MKDFTTILLIPISKLLLISFLFTIIACDDSNPVSEEPSVKSRGEIIESNLAMTYSAEDVGSALNFLGSSFPFEMSNSVKYVRIVYQTINQHGELSQASGGLFIPVSDDSLPLLSLQHGTEVKRENVASTTPLSSVEATTGLLTGAMGYVTAVPDYIGFGVSIGMHPYLHAESLTTEVIDFIRAVKHYCSENSVVLNDDLFLSGYSEGGYVSLATQKEIEENYSDEFNITAVLPLAGPYDLAGTILDGFRKNTYPEPAYIAYLFTAYNEIYGWDKLQDIFTAPYSEKVADLFNGTLTWGEVVNQLPDTMDDLIQTKFITDYLSGDEEQIKSAFEENTLLNWSPESPICFVHGTDDQIVPYSNAVNTFENLSGATNEEIKLVPIEGGTHETAGEASIMVMLEFIEGYRNTGLLAKVN